MAHNHIESDRRSAVSSFYGGRKSSIDMLSSDANMRSGTPLAASGSRHDRDDASSFFASSGPRRSHDLLVGQSAGYNRASYLDVGREAPVKGTDETEDAAFLGARPGAGRGDEEAGWDVYADFNNAGPKYSSAFVKYDQNDEGYQRLPPENSPHVHNPVKLEEDTSMSPRGGPVELVTVPALGAEWKKSELEAMTKKGRKKRKESDKMDNFKIWWRDQRGCCGRWGTRKHIAIGAFVVCSIVGIIIAFTLPRVPAVTFATSSPLLNGTAPPDFIFSRSPANFTFPAKLDLRVETGSNFLPLRFNTISATISDLNTNQEVGTGNMSTTVPARTSTEIQIPIDFTYIAINDTDQTWMNWYDACRNSALYPDGQRPGVDMRVQIDMSIAGLIGNRRRTVQITNVACPWELPQNAA